VTKPLVIKKHEADMREMVSDLLGEFDRNPEDYEQFTSLVLVGTNNEDNFEKAMKTNDPRCHLDLNVSLSFFVASLLSLQRLIPEALIILNWPPDYLMLAPLIHLISSVEPACMILLRAPTLMLTTVLVNRKWAK
jgi:hypothetical protein